MAKSSSRNSKVRSQLVWQIDLQALIGKRIVVETHDGHYVTGVLIGIEWGTLKMLGEEWEYPKSLRFNAEEADGVPWNLVKGVRLARRPKSEQDTK